MKTFTDQEIDQSYARAPKAIQELLTDGLDLAETISGIRRSYVLHVDISGSIGVLVRNMLLGLLSPQEFFQELKSLGVDEAQARQITDDINKKIFAPLQSKMRQGGGGQTAQPAAKPPVQSQAIQSQPKVAVPSYQPPKPPQVPQMQPRPSMPQPPRPQMPMQQAVPQGSRQIAPPTNLPGVDRMLPDHEEPHIQLGRSESNVGSSQPKPLPTNYEPPTTPPPAPKPAAKPLATYSADPYRELIDDK